MRSQITSILCKILVMTSCTAIIIYSDCIAAGSCVNKTTKYYVEEIFPDTYAISECGGLRNNSYLIIGKKMAILFDTGYTIKAQEMKDIVKALTDKPVEATFSHTHFDHIKFLNEFDYVAMPYIEPYKKCYNEKNKTFKPTFSMSGLCFPSIINTSETWKPGETIDLGERRLELVYLPGHSDTSIALIDDELKICFSGDFIYENGDGAFGPFMDPIMPGASLNSYLASADYILARAPGYTFLCGHTKPQIPYFYVQQLELTLKGIKEGKISGDCVIPFLLKKFVVEKNGNNLFTLITCYNTNY